MIIYEDILKEFQKKKVKYIIVGGIAVNLLGSLRSTADLDLLVDMSEKNLMKTVTSLKKIGYRARQAIDPMRITDEKTRNNWIKNRHMKALNFYKEKWLKEIDVIIDSPVSYEEARKTATYIKVDKFRLPVISIDNLIRMKKNINRAVDKFDIGQLKKIKELRKKK